MPNVLVTHDRHDYRFWDAVAGYYDGSCVGCGTEGICFQGMCQPCWTGSDDADDVQRALDAAKAAVRKAAELLAEVTDVDRLREIHRQAADVSAMGSNLRLDVMKKLRSRR